MWKFFAGAPAVGLFLGKLYFDSLIAGAALTVLLLLLYPYFRRMEDEKAKRELLIQFKDLLYSLAASFSVGRNMRQALKESLDFWGNTYGEKDRIVMEVRRMIRGMEDANETDVTVLRDFAERSGLRDIMDFVNVYESSKSTGADMGRAIARATGVIADRIDMDRELKSMMAAKLSEGRIVGLAPVALVLAMRVFAPGYMEPMYSTASGAVAALISLSLSGIAIFMTERINRVDF